MHDENMKITIPGFYDKVVDLNSKDKKEILNDYLIGLQICPHSDHTYCGKNNYCINYFDEKVSEVVPPHGLEPRTY